MSPTGASLVATPISFVVFILVAVWYAAPWMSRRPLAIALSAPLWIHAFRYVALQAFSAQRFGFRIPDSLARQIVWGDVAGAVLALAALWLLRSRSRIAIAVIWLFVLETVADFVNASAISIRERTSETAHALTWLILNMYRAVAGGEPRPARLASGVSSRRGALRRRGCPGHLARGSPLGRAVLPAGHLRKVT